MNAFVLCFSFWEFNWHSQSVIFRVFILARSLRAASMPERNHMYICLCVVGILSKRNEQQRISKRFNSGKSFPEIHGTRRFESLHKSSGSVNLCYLSCYLMVYMLELIDLELCSRTRNLVPHLCNLFMDKPSWKRSEALWNFSFFQYFAI